MPGTAVKKPIPMVGLYYDFLKRPRSAPCIITVPLVVLAAGNAWEHHMVRYRREQTEKVTMRAVLTQVRHGLVRRVHFVRLSPQLMDSDNLPGAFKAVRDEIARWLGVDDGPKGPITWTYDQRRQVQRGIEVSFS